jgi:hypothetical protein
VLRVDFALAFFTPYFVKQFPMRGFRIKAADALFLQMEHEWQLT